MLAEIKKSSLENLTLCFAGVGSAFAKKNAQTSLIIAKNGTTVLVDLGNTVPPALWEKDIPITDFDFYHFTHSHADHIGGVEELFLLARYTQKPKPQVIITETYQAMLWRRSLSGGCEYNESGLVRFSDLAMPFRPLWLRSVPREIYEINVNGLHLLIFRTKHIPGDVACWEEAFWSTGLLIDGRVLFTADTRFDVDLFTDLETSGYPMVGVEAIFHDCQLNGPGTVHATYGELQTLPDDLKNKMWLTHYGDNFAEFDPVAAGFQGFARPWNLYEFPLEKRG